MARGRRRSGGPARTLPAAGAVAGASWGGLALAPAAPRRGGPSSSCAVAASGPEAAAALAREEVLACFVQGSPQSAALADEWQAFEHGGTEFDVKVAEPAGGHW